jgi:hypothetical protein
MYLCVLPCLWWAIMYLVIIVSVVCHAVSVVCINVSVDPLCPVFSVCGV